jgi:hypothetical protein
MFSTTGLNTLALVLLTLVRTSAAVSMNFNCTVGVASAAVEDTSTSVKACIQGGKDDCELPNVNYSSYKLSCETEGGQVYEPTKTFKCKDGANTTSITQKYVTCVGSSCITDESDFVDEYVQNYTAEVQNYTASVLNVDGIECAEEFSGAKKVFGFAASTMMIAGSTMMAL